MTSIINPSKKFIFVHVHKCAGSAITKAFLGEKAHENTEWQSPRDSLDVSQNIMTENNKILGSQFSAPDHFRAIDMREFLGDDIYNSYYKFAVSRNPWDRLASWYFFLRQYQNKGQSKVALQTTMEDFIKYSVNEFYLPQCHWVTDANGKIIVDDIIKLDDLQREWPLVSSKVSKNPIELRSVNRSVNTTEPSSNPFSQVRTKTLNMFVEAYASDFELLGYSKKLPIHRNENLTLQSCEKIWLTELKGERNIEDQCEAHGISVELYAMYREANSGYFYSSYLTERLQSSGEKTVSKLKEKLTNTNSTNRKLREKFKTDFDAMQAKFTTLKAEKTKQKNAHADEIKKLNAASAKFSKLSSDLALERTANRELREKFKTDFDAMQAKFKTLKAEKTKQKKAHAGEIKKLNAASAKFSKLSSDLALERTANRELREKFKTDFDAMQSKFKSDLDKLQSKLKTVKADKSKTHETELKKLNAEKSRLGTLRDELFAEKSRGIKLREEIAAAKRINLELRERFKANADEKTQKIQDLLTKIAKLSK